MCEKKAIYHANRLMHPRSSESCQLASCKYYRSYILQESASTRDHSAAKRRVFTIEDMQAALQVRSPSKTTDSCFPINFNLDELSSCNPKHHSFFLQRAQANPASVGETLDWLENDSSTSSESESAAQG